MKYGICRYSWMKRSNFREDKQLLSKQVLEELGRKMNTKDIHANIYAHIRKYMYIHAYINTHTNTHVCLCVCKNCNKKDTLALEGKKSMDLSWQKRIK